MQSKILIKGAGEMASATAHRLFQCGFRVAMTDLDRPSAVRRHVCFCSALYGRQISVEGVCGVGYQLSQAGFLEDFDWKHIPVFADPECRLLQLWKPDVIVDARICKTNLDNHLNDASLVIGLGPGLEAGKDVHYVIETNRGHHLGRIIQKGTAAADTGQPGNIGGYTHERVFRAPGDGVFESRYEIGQKVQAGAVLGTVDGIEIPAKIAGVIRGMVFPGLMVTRSQKLGDIDPRGEISYCDTISDKARTISGSVLELVVRYATKR